jgi:hypothetical protein
MRAESYVEVVVRFAVLALVILSVSSTHARGQQSRPTNPAPVAPSAAPAPPVYVPPLLRLPVRLFAGQLFRTVEISVDYLPGKTQYHTGTAFFISHDGVTYLVSARHVFEGISEASSVKLWIKGSKEWSVLNIVVHYPDDQNVDVAVATLTDPHEKTSGFDICGETNKLDFGDEGLFLGFPYGFDSDPNVGAASMPLDVQGRVIPFVKRATLSGMIQVAPGTNVVLVLDGINNEGFSGGPLIFSSVTSGSCVAGVIISYLTSSEPVMDQTNQATTQSVRANTGLIYATPTGYVNDLIKNLVSSSAAK